MSGKSDDINFPIPTKSEPGINSPEGSSSTFKYEDPELVDHYEFFKLCKINIEEDDVTSLLEDGYTMEEILFTVQNSPADDISLILTSLKSNIPKALKSRFRNMCLIIREYMNKFTNNGMLPKDTTMEDIMEWHHMDKNLNQVSSIPKAKSNESMYLENQVSKITNLVNRQCQTIKDTLITPLPKIREQQYQVEWEEDVKLVMGSNNASYLLDKKVLHDDFSECTVDINIIQIQDSRFWYDLMKAVRNSDVEHTILRYENYYKNGQNRASGRKAWLAITEYRNTSEQNLLSYKVSKKIMEELRYDAKKTQFGHFLNEFEKNYKRYNILGRRIHSYWTPTFEVERKLELFNNTIIFSSLDPHSQSIVFKEHRYPTMTYDELTQELRKAQSTLDILESVTTKSNVRRTTKSSTSSTTSTTNTTSNQNTTNSTNGKPKNSNSETRLNVRNTTYEFENNKYETDDNGNLSYVHINNILGKDIYKRTTHKQRASLVSKFRNAKGTFHEYVENIRKLSKDFMRQNEANNVDIAACNEKYINERRELREKQNSQNSNINNTNNNENNAVRRKICIKNKSNNKTNTTTVKDSIENVYIEINDDNSHINSDNSKESKNTDLSSLRRYQNNKGIIILDSGAQQSCNGTIGPLITYRGKKYSGVVGPSFDMISKRINNTTS